MTQFINLDENNNLVTMCNDTTESDIIVSAYDQYYRNELFDKFQEYVFNINDKSEISGLEHIKIQIENKIKELEEK